jgi:hypothetical protein
VREGKAEKEGMSQAVLMRELSIKTRTATGLIIGAISAFFLILIVGIIVLNGIQSSSDTSLDNRSKEAIQTTKDNFILGMAILGIGGAFGIIAYYYTTIGFGSNK